MDQHGGLNVRSKRRCNWAPSPPNASRPNCCKSDQAALILPLSEAPRQLCKAVVLWQRLRSSRGAASRWFKVGLPAQRWSSIPTCRSQLYGHFTSLSVHGQETCQSKTPPWQQFCVVLWRRSRAPPFDPAQPSPRHPKVRLHLGRTRDGGDMRRFRLWKSVLEFQ